MCKKEKDQELRKRNPPLDYKSPEEEISFTLLIPDSEMGLRVGRKPFSKGAVNMHTEIIKITEVKSSYRIGLPL